MDPFALRSSRGRLQGFVGKTKNTFRTKLVVAAIDFGTTYSGYAYSFKSEYEKNPLKVFIINFNITYKHTYLLLILDLHIS